MKKLSKLISLILCLSFLFSTVSFAADTPAISSNMIDICVASTEDYLIYVSVPETEADSYQKRLENDPEFRKNEIQQALGNTADTRALPPGKIVHQSYMYESDISIAVDKVAGPGAYLKWFNAIPTLVQIGDIIELIELTKKQNVYVFVAGLLGAAIMDAQTYREKWWYEALADISNHKISAVRYTIVENPTEYPKIWRVFERI